MNTPIEEQELKTLITTKPYKWQIILKTERLDLYNYLTTKYKYLVDTTLITKAYWLLHNLTDTPICPTCNKHFSYSKNVFSLAVGYRTHCSKRCALISTNKNPMHSRNVSLSLLRRTASEKQQAKTKFKQTCLERFGVENPAQAASIKTKMKQTCLEKYGVENPYQSKTIKEKIKQTCLEKYGVEYYLQTATAQSVKIYINSERAYTMMLNSEYDTPQFSLTEFISRNKYDIFKFKCKQCGRIFTTKHYDGKQHHCQYCYPSDALASKSEYELQLYIRTITDVDICCNDRLTIEPLELDIYIPSKQLAFEFDGLYWHSESIKSDKNYHLNKTNLCEAKNIHLIHIFENDWLYKQDIVKSRICNLLNKNVITVGARLCEIRQIADTEATAFQQDNHIQGVVHAKVNLGLYYANNLVSLMTFSKPRFSKQYDWELVRFCNKLGYHVPGAAGKLLSHFEKTYNPKSLVSYADRRWSYSKKNVYQTLGFTLSHVSAPNYWYWKGDEFASRVKYQKHKLASLLENYDPNLNETDNMYANGYNKIFDCGNLVYIKHYVV